jgi:hypothetical protein
VSAGDGTASITAYRADTKSGNVAVRLKTTGTTSYVGVISSCIPVSPSTDYYFEVTGKSISTGSCHSYACAQSFYGYFAQFTDGACANQTSYSTAEIVTDFPKTWKTYGTQKTTSGSTNSIKLYFSNYHFDGDYLIDTVSMKAGTYHTPWVQNAGAGTTTYNVRNLAIRNTLADPTNTGVYPYTTGFCASTWVYTDYSGAGITAHKIIAQSTPIMGANYWYMQVEAGDYVATYIYDNAGGAKVTYLVTNATNWSASNWHYIEVCTSNSGAPIAHHYNKANSTWYTWISSGAGTGILSSMSTNLSVGSNIGGTSNLNGYLSNVCLKPYSATYTNCGFNGGVPPAATPPY